MEVVEQLRLSLQPVGTDGAVPGHGLAVDVQRQIAVAELRLAGLSVGELNRGIDQRMRCNPAEMCPGHQRPAQPRRLRRVEIREREVLGPGVHVQLPLGSEAARHRQLGAARVQELERLDLQPRLLPVQRETRRAVSELLVPQRDVVEHHLGHAIRSRRRTLHVEHAGEVAVDVLRIAHGGERGHQPDREVDQVVQIRVRQLEMGLHRNRAVAHVQGDPALVHAAILAPPDLIEHQVHRAGAEAELRRDFAEREVEEPEPLRRSRAVDGQIRVRPRHARRERRFPVRRQRPDVAVEVVEVDTFAMPEQLHSAPLIGEKRALHLHFRSSGLDCRPAQNDLVAIDRHRAGQSSAAELEHPLSAALVIRLVEHREIGQVEIRLGREQERRERAANLHAPARLEHHQAVRHAHLAQDLLQLRVAQRQVGGERQRRFLEIELRRAGDDALAHRQLEPVQLDALGRDLELDPRVAGRESFQRQRLHPQVAFHPRLARGQ